MKNNTSRFLNAFDRFNVTDIKKITFAIPAVVVLIAVLVIVGVGATSGSYIDGVGIGIDFEGGTMLTVNVGQVTDANADIQAEIDKITAAIEGVKDSAGRSA